jgi:hypothetical protein
LSCRPFSVQKGRAGWKWLYNFMSRRCASPKLLRQHESSDSRNKTKRHMSEPQLRLIDFSPHRVFNCDDTGQHEACEDVSLKGKRRVCLGSLVATVTCRNVPPLLVFPRSNMKAELLVGASPVQWQLVTKLDDGSRKRTSRNSSNILCVL